ncbi:MAG: hypothetical protein J0L60_06525 [Ignavibacteria bacterium]|nr:hypothetical protein [Ignavibacteria bacterium]
MIAILINSVDFSDHVVKCDRIPVCVRNRDFSPVAEGFGFSLGWNISEIPEVGDIVVVKYGTTNIYHGYLTKIANNWNERTYDLTVENSLFKLRNVLIESAKLRNLIVQTNGFDTGSAFTVTEGLCMATDHGLVTDQPIIFMTDGTLPAPLRDDRYYYAFYESSDSFRVRLKPDDLGFVDLTSPGSGTNKFILPDLNLYKEIDNEECPNANLAWALKMIFIAAGLKLDTTAVDELVLFSTSVEGVGTEYKFKDIKIDLNMLFAINQDYAFNNTKIDDTDGYTYFQNKVNSLDFLFFVCSMFGFTLQFYSETGGITYKLLAPTSFTYSVADNDKFSFSTETLPDELVSGYSAVISYNTDRTKYKNTVETDITDVKIVSVGNAEEEVKWYSNFIPLLKDKRGVALPGNVLPLSTYPYPHTSALYFKVRFKDYEHLRETIETNVVLTNPFVVENYINPEKLTSEIVQENIL